MVLMRIRVAPALIGSLAFFGCGILLFWLADRGYVGFLEPLGDWGITIARWMGGMSVFVSFFMPLVAASSRFTILRARGTTVALVYPFGLHKLFRSRSTLTGVVRSETTFTMVEPRRRNFVTFRFEHQGRELFCDLQKSGFKHDYEERFEAWRSGRGV